MQGLRAHLIAPKLIESPTHQLTCLLADRLPHLPAPQLDDLDALLTQHQYDLRQRAARLRAEKQVPWRGEGEKGGGGEGRERCYCAGEGCEVCCHATMLTILAMHTIRTSPTTLAARPPLA